MERALYPSLKSGVILGGPVSPLTKRLRLRLGCDTTRKDIRLFVRGYVGFAMADHLFRSLPHTTPDAGFHGADAWMDQQLVRPVAVLEEALLYTSMDFSCVILTDPDSLRQIVTTYRIANSTTGEC